MAIDDHDLIQQRPLLKFLEDGQFTDFQIHTRGCYFKVHRVVVATKSKYFENVCGGNFKEGTDGFVVIDEDPMLFARLVVAMYTDNNEATFGDEVPKTVCDNAQISDSSLGTGEVASHKFDGTNDWKLHCKMFALAESYEVSNLVYRTAYAFYVILSFHIIPRIADGGSSDRYDNNSSMDLVRKTTARSELPPQTAGDDLTCIIDYLYDEGYTLSKEFRNALILNIMKVRRELQILPAFRDLLSANEEFAFDCKVRGPRMHLLYCPDCNMYLSTKRSDCGLRGFCERSRCNRDFLPMMRCLECGNTGKVMREPTADFSTSRFYPRVERLGRAELRYANGVYNDYFPPRMWESESDLSLDTSVCSDEIWDSKSNIPPDIFMFSDEEDNQDA